MHVLITVTSDYIDVTS